MTIPLLYCLSYLSIVLVSGKPDGTHYHSHELPNLLKEYLDLNEGETSSSLHTFKNLTLWAAKEEDIKNVLRERLRNIQIETNMIQRYLNDYKDTTDRALKNLKKPRQTAEERGKVIGSHFILGHKMICRYSSFIKHLRNYLQSAQYDKNKYDVRETLELGHGTQWPNLMDKYFSMLGILHIQHVYGISAKYLRQGLTVDSNFGGKLNALNCYDIGAFALYRRYYYAAVDWLETAKLQTLEIENGDWSLHWDSVDNMLNAAIRQHNKHLYDPNISKEYFYTKYTFEGDTRRVRNMKQMYDNHRQLNNSHPAAQYVGLCSGITFQTPAMQINLKCFYTRHHPYLLINPVKTEQLSESPPLFQLYEMLGPEAIEKIKAKASPKLKRSEMMDHLSLAEMTEFRTTVSALLFYHEVPWFYKFAEAVTNLVISPSGEVAEFAEYTYGRQYAEHTDSLGNSPSAADNVIQYGDRVSTLLYIVETPEAGGKTVFCNAGVHGRQVKGSALLWFMMYRNGTVRHDGFHGGCPIFHGHKMIISHKMRYNANFQKFKCSLNQFE